MPKPSGQWLIPILLALGAGAGLWYYWSQLAEPPAPETTETAPIAAESPPSIGPLHPVAPEQPEPGPQPDLVPLPPLGESDEYFRLGLVDLFGAPVETWLADSGIIQRVVATVDALPRTHVAERIRPLGRLQDTFLVDAQDDSGDYWINADNYHRYDLLIDLAMSADVNDVADLYRRFYPLFQAAYVGLGDPDGYFNDRLGEVIDHLLETPDVEGRIALVRPHVLYEYRDPDLEALSSGQKLLLRMGADNAGRAKARLSEFRTLITAM
jgi:hypothetical protein